MVWPVMKAESASGKERDRADDVGRRHVAREHAGARGDLAYALDQLGVLEHAVAQRESRRHAVDQDVVAAELGGERPRQRHHRALACHVVRHARIALEGDAGGDVDDASRRRAL